MHNRKSKTFESKISKTWRENREGIIDRTIQTISFYKFNIIINRIVYSFKIKVLFLTLTIYKYNWFIWVKVIEIFKILYLC